MSTTAGMLGLHIADLRSDDIDGAGRVVFSVFALNTQQWIENDRQILIEPDEESEVVQDHVVSAV